MKPTVVCMGWFMVALSACGSATPTTVVASPTTAANTPNQADQAVRSPIGLADTELRAAVLASKDWPRITRSALPKNELCAPAAPTMAIATGSHPDHIGEQFHLYLRVGNTAYTEGHVMPAGTMIVKRSFQNDEANGTTAYFVMYKRTGQNPAGGDWLYATTHANGEVIRAGVLADCAGCHDNQRDQDFLFRHY